MPRLEELNLLPEKPAPVDLGDMPEQRQENYYLPQPGDYIWRLPADLSDIYETFATDQGQRVVAKFKGGRMLINEHGERLMQDIKNTDRADFKTGKKFNDFAYLLSALGFEGRLEDNGQYISALAGCGGKLFKAELVWTATDRNTKQGFKQRGYKITRGPNAGTEYLALPKIGNKFQENFMHEGQEIRAFGNLKNFRSV